MLHGVQLIDHDAATMASRLFMADDLRFQLDREKGTMILLFQGGFCRDRSGRREFPAAGEPLALFGVDGRYWEDRLPYLVEASGEYPVSSPPGRPNVMSPSSRADWKRRINGLIAASKSGTRYRLDRFRDLEDARFADALLLGYDEKKILVSSVEAGRLWVHVDEATGTVELRMESGTLRQRGGESTIPEAGHRIRLRGVTPGQASESMLGMVIRR